MRTAALAALAALGLVLSSLDVTGSTLRDAPGRAEDSIEVAIAARCEAVFLTVLSLPSPEEENHPILPIAQPVVRTHLALFETLALSIVRSMEEHQARVPRMIQEEAMVHGASHDDLLRFRHRAREAHLLRLRATLLMPERIVPLMIGLVAEIEECLDWIAEGGTSTMAEVRR